MPAPGFKKLDEDQVRKLQIIEGRGPDQAVLPKLLDDALDVAQAEVSGLVAALSGKLDASKLAVIDSDVSVGGNATESLTFTGMLGTDTILALTGKTAGANAVAVQAFGAPGADALSVTFTGDPGAGAVVRALVLRA